MGFWEENKKLCLGLLAALVALLVLWPSFKDGRSGILSPWKPRYGKLQEDERTNDEEINKHFNKKNQPTSEVISQARRYNSELEQQYRELRNHVIFFAPTPFRIASWDAQPGLRFLEIQNETHTRDLLQYISLRNVLIDDKYVGLDQGGVPPEEKSLPLLLRQAAMIDDLVRKAADCGVRSIDKVIHYPPIKAGPLNRPHFLKMYPVRMRVGAPVEAIMKFMNSLDGYHGKVTQAGTSSRQEGGEMISERIIRIDVGSRDGLTNEHAITFTIFDEEPDEEDGLRYKGRATVIRINEDHCIATVPEGPRKDIWDDEERNKREVVKGDLATTNFYTLIDLKIQGQPPREKNSLTNDIEAVITVAALGLLEEAKTYGSAGGKTTKTRKRPPTRVWGGY